MCSKRTAYLQKPEARFFEYDDEQEEFNPFEEYTEGCPLVTTIPTIYAKLFSFN